MIPPVVIEAGGKVLAKTWKPLAIVLAGALALGGAVFYGYTHGRDARQAEIDGLTDKLATAKAQVVTLSRAAVQNNLDAEQAKKRADLAKKFADAAIERQRQLEKQRGADKADFERQLAAARKRPECGAAKELICAAIPYPY